LAVFVDLVDGRARVGDAIRTGELAVLTIKTPILLDDHDHMLDLVERPSRVRGRCRTADNEDYYACERA
jgi:hypothetical protein